MSTTTQTRTAGPNPGHTAHGSVVERIKARAIESRENSKANHSNGRRTSQPAKKDMPNYPGLERWSLIEKIGDGAFSTVYRASDTKSEFNEVAVKVIRKYEMNDNQKQKLVKEVEIARKLKHENVVQLIDSSESRQYSYMVLELCPGGELYHQITQLTSLDETLSRHIIKQVAKAVKYLHETMGIVHRDIKPENILFYPKSGNVEPEESNIGVVKLADFGLSKMICGVPTMTPCGTMGYAAPELCKEQTYTTGVDMWALGCLLYTMLGGFPPFYDEDFQTMARKVLRGEYSFASPNWDPISDEAKDLISGLLAVRPEERLNIKQLLAHPWIRQTSESQPPSQAPTPKIEFPDAEPQSAPIGNAALDPFQEAIDSRPGSPVAHTPNIRDIFNVALSVQQQSPGGRRPRGSKHMSSGVRPNMRPAPVARFSEMNMDNCTPSSLARSRPHAVNRANRIPSSETTTGDRFNKATSSLHNLNLNNSSLLEKRRMRCGGASTPTRH